MPMSVHQQKKYFRREVFPEYSKTHPKQILFSIRESGEFVGYAGLVHVDWVNKRAEVSFLLKPSISEDKLLYEEIFRGTLRIMRKVGFEELGLNRIFTETYSGRLNHLEILPSCGFDEEGRMRGHVLIEGVFRDSYIHGCLANEQRKIDN